MAENFSHLSSPRLSLCMIVRDAAGTLPACLAGIRPWVDELVIVDTGSLDSTRQIARDHGARLFEFPWCDDFSAARNESLRHARGDWLFWIDADDTIDEVNGRKLRDLASGEHPHQVLGYVLQVHCPGPRQHGANDARVRSQRDHRG
jgi:O-antigen biosynthesis protein